MSGVWSRGSGDEGRVDFGCVGIVEVWVVVIDVVAYQVQWRPSHLGLPARSGWCCLARMRSIECGWCESGLVADEVFSS